ncbi:MAG TPA: response regulator [Candidatus Tumulicola sp.]|nr:response regulator [Candidatus Tumulicola sp.]
MNDFDDVETLLVEDSKHDAEMTMRALKKGNFLNKVFWVQDGVEALEFLRCEGDFKSRDPQQLPKLILLDLKMPRLDGLDVLRELKKDARTRAIPVVAMTSSNHTRDITASYRLGANGYVVKPVQFGAFVETVAQIGMFWLCVNRTEVT